MKMRKDSELPQATMEWGWRYHHIGVPTSRKMPDERYIPHLKFYVSGFPESPVGVEWMRFEPECPLPELIQHTTHVAFEVDDLDLELKRHNFKILTPPNLPSDGVRVAMVEINGAPVELMEFDR